jgi:RNA polymerase-binding transcription factor DksA
MRFAPGTLATMRRALLRRGQNLAELLSQVMAGKQPPQLSALLAEKPGKRPEEVLREALAQIDGRRKLIDADDDRFGRCDVCGADLGEPAMLEVPWADRCAAHATR